MLPALTVRATHEPQAADVIAAAQSLYMECFADVGTEVCLGSSQAGQRDASIAPQSGPLDNVTTHVTALFGRTGWEMYPDDQSFNVTLHNVGCSNANAVAAFVASVAALSNSGAVGPKTVGECSMTGSLSAGGDINQYTITSVLLPSAFSPTPNPTVKPTATPIPTAKPTAVPTATPRPTPTPTPAATPRVTARPTPRATAGATPATSTGGSASASASASATGSAAETATATPNGTPEQSVAGIFFTPTPTDGVPAPAGADSGWAGSVPSTRDVSTDPAALGSSALAALLLLLAMGFIGELFNNTFEANYDRILAWWGTSRLGRIGRAFSGLWGGGR